MNTDVYKRQETDLTFLSPGKLSFLYFTVSPIVSIFL